MPPTRTTFRTFAELQRFPALTFFRMEGVRSDSAGGGAGLGLPIARRIAMLYGGDVKLVDSGAAGSTFELMLPLSGSVPERC